MKDGNQPKQANEKMKPKQQEGEEFGSTKHRQVDDAHHPNRSDTQRGSEPETRGESGRRS